MNDKELQKELNRRNKLRQLETLEANDTRAQSITVGTAGGGTVEITMRSQAGKFMWNTYQPVEVVELINQLAAGIGCHIHILPRKDFASWRDWKVSEEELAHFRGVQYMPGIGFAPHAKLDWDGQYAGVGNTPFRDNEQSLLDRRRGTTPLPKEKENVAIEEAVNKRTTKRSRSPSK